MKIRFDNNSVSGVNRKYRGFVLDIPGHSSQVIDVPVQYVKDALSYLGHRHPAVACTPLVEEVPEEKKPESTSPSEAEAVADQTEKVVDTETSDEDSAGEAVNEDAPQRAEKTDAKEEPAIEAPAPKPAAMAPVREAVKEGKAKFIAPKPKAGSSKEAGKGETKKNKKGGGKK
jgi:hypothetical protein